MATPDAATERPGLGRLVVCPTPIGNLGDVTLRVLEALRTVDVVACEDTRRTRTLLARFEIAATLVSYHEHNERERSRQLLARIEAGEAVALVSDAGMPLVSDPGYEIVRACIAAELPVEVLPGASSVITALVASGLPAERWRFAGFLPSRGSPHRGGQAGGKRSELARMLSDIPETLVAFESPARLVATMELLAEIDAERPVAVCRELTKLHEEVRRGSASALADHYRAHPPRGEIVLVVGASAPERAGHDEALAAVRALVEAGARTRPAASVVAKLTGGSANELYRALAEERVDKT